MKKSLLIFLGFASILSSCSKEEVNNQSNQKPEAFDLVSVINGELNVGLKPTFIWEPALDPEGFNVTYDLLLGTSENDLQPIASNINGTSFVPTTRLPLSENLFWSVRANDNVGAQTQANSTFNFTTRNLTNGTLALNGFTLLNEHTTVVFQDKLWILGGEDNGVRNSSDGVNWTVINANPPFGSRKNHSSVVFDNKIWVIGGKTNTTNNKNDVWFSTDGVTWTQATAAAAFSIRQGHSSVVFDNKMWVIGGHLNPSQSLHDVWFSTDGIDWLPATNNANIAFKQDHATVVFNNKMYLVNGNEVRSSTNGGTWQLETTVTNFGNRSRHQLVVYDNKIWLIAGFATIDRNDVWFSKDGINWIRNVESANFNDRSDHTATAFKDKIWVIGGLKLFASSSEEPNNGIWFLD
ncbi:kelch repeat-containing protein [Flavobacterium sp. J27]|uniref:Kelch repeat-containing protein n=1 Tax=Flavobacterium sp. J27 TaxID=2060419 RepID=UPI0013EE50C3|nr:kelch repeat-containing protein [Flavobacterium sp. J27]